MSEEEVRQKMLDIVGDIYHAKFAEHGLNGYTKFDGHTWVETRDVINKTFDDLTIDHPKVKLPREVGEELDDWKFKWGIDVGEYLTSICTSDEDTPKAQEWRETGIALTRSAQLVEAFNHGWEAEPEAKWYVKVPDSWNGPACEYPWTVKCSDGEGVVRGSERENDPRYQFTRAELKQYHFDSDIFTLVPVGEEK